MKTLKALKPLAYFYAAVCIVSLSIGFFHGQSPTYALTHWNITVIETARQWELHHLGIVIPGVLLALIGSWLCFRLASKKSKGIL